MKVIVSITEVADMIKEKHNLPRNSFVEIEMLENPQDRIFGTKIKCIKKFKEMTGMSLKEAKDVVDEIFK